MLYIIVIPTTVTVRYIRNISLIVAVASVVGAVSAMIAVSAKWTLVILPTADVQLTKACCKCGWGLSTLAAVDRNSGS